MKTIKILATSDLHSYVYPYKYSDNKEATMGLSKISTLINSLKDENTLIIDNGDVLQGSPLSFYHYHHDKDSIHPITLAMQQIQYDYINIGNHDFNYGTAELKKHLDYLNAPCITNNVFINQEAIGPTYVMRTLPNGIKVALFGVLTQYVPHWEKANNIQGCEFVDAYEAASSAVALIKKLEKPDIIVGVYHGGFEKDLHTGKPTEFLSGENEAYQMCEHIQGLDVLISGHQHRTIADTCCNVHVTQTACNGGNLAVINAGFDDDNHLLVVDTETLEPNCEVDTSITSLLDDVEHKTQQWLDQPLGTTTMDLLVTNDFDARLHKHPIVSYLNQVQFDLTHADICASALFNDAPGFKKEVTMRDLVSTYVYPNTTIVKKLSGKVLKQYLEKCAEFFSIKDGSIVINPKYEWPKPQYYNYDMLDGIEYTLDISRLPGERVTSLTFKGNQVKDTDEFTVSMNNYRASGGGNFNMLPDCPIVAEYQDDMVEVLANYMEAHPDIVVDHKDNVTIIG